MLPNHRPLIVAEQFAMLEALHPGRIDLGVGRSLGFTAPVREALGVTEYGTVEFGRDLAAVRDFLHGRGPVTASPVVPAPPVFVLATGSGLEVAADAGLPVVVGGPRLLADPSPLERYRETFRPSSAVPEPYVVVNVDVMIAGDTTTARELLLPEAWAMAASRETGVFGPLQPVGDVLALTMRPQQRRRIDQWLAGTVHGTAGEVASELARLIDRTGADEIMASTSTFDRDELAKADAAFAELVH